MLAVISPAKPRYLNTPVPPVAVTQPTFLQQAEPLAQAADRLSKARLAQLMHISDKLAQLTAERFAEYAVPITADTASPAIYTFAGDVYTGFEVRTLDEAAGAVSQDNVRIRERKDARMNVRHQ